ncbi:MAG TPA: DUF5668 domain-containing protein [Candidatus Acidoferrum sp.]|nr:DUF5668 domain-containing protein [Candidatus Acidoferrum sp.]
MSAHPRCYCPSCTIRNLTGPAVVITIGVLFLLHQVQGGRFWFGNTWPVILLVIGVLQVAAALAPRDGHVDPVTPGIAPPSPPMGPQPPVAPPRTPYSAQGQ